MALKPKKCKSLECDNTFQPMSSTQTGCSWPCALQIAQQNKKKRYRDTTTALKKQFLSTDRRHWKTKAATACHKYIILRDASLPCVSCGRNHQGQYHAGHYLTRGAHPEIQFHPFNIHKQCAPCNTHLSGNIIKYRPNLISRIGLNNVEWIESYHEPYKYTIDDFKQIHTWYSELRHGLQLVRRASAMPGE